MLQWLSIRNIVLISEAEIAFGSGFTVLTGETGAGKSILLDALGLALGERSEARLLRPGEKEGEVSVEFDISRHPRIPAFLEEIGIASEDRLMLRRILYQDGKTRAFVNDRPVGIGALKDLGALLVEVHGQHSQRGLMQSSTHRDALDKFAGLAKETSATAETWKQWQEAKHALLALQQSLETAEREREFLLFAAEELRALGPLAGEEETLIEQRRILTQAAKTSAALEEVSQALEGDRPLFQYLRDAEKALARSGVAPEEMAALLASVERAGQEIEEAVRNLDGLKKRYRPDETQLERISDRLFSLRDMARKYRVGIEELAAIAEEIFAKCELLSNEEKRLSAETAREAETKAAYLAKAEILSAARKKAAGKLEKAVMAELAPLKMGGMGFRARISEAEPSEHGTDNVAFEIMANPGSPYAPLAKIASGGELSRFMLALKLVLHQVSSVPTLIFDEIDSGIGGAVAEAVGERLAKLGEHVQVMAVTHLPQVAAKAEAHLRIQKTASKKQTATSVEPLKGNARKEELARMLAGAEITKEAQAAAARLLAR